MLLLLNFRHNQQKKEAEEKRRRQRRMEKREAREAGREESNTDPKAKAKTKAKAKAKAKPKSRVCRRDPFANLPPERKWEAYAIVLIGLGLPGLYGLYNAGLAACTKLLLPAVSAWLPNVTLTPYQLTPEFVEAERGRGLSEFRSSYEHNVSGVDRRSQLSLAEYYAVYDAKWPVIIADCVPKWPAATLWNADWFARNYGDHRVTMAATAGGLGRAEQMALPLKLFLEHLNESSPTAWTYLQDELFLPTRPKLLQQIGVCDVLKEDFFSLFPQSARPWWAFMLWGTRYSRSHLHIDPYNWTGTNAVLSGRKRWIMYPPGQDHLLYTKKPYLGKYPLPSYKYNSKVDLFDDDSLRQHPLVKRAKFVEFVQNPGELLIIPTGWFHQAFNEEPTLAVAGQLMNRGNRRVVLEELMKAGALTRDNHRRDFHSLTPEQQVQESVLRLSAKALAEAAEVTRSVLEQVETEGKRYSGEL